jgi:hypothetical protein
VATPEEFEVIIDKDGRIRLNFRGMCETSYRRIVEVLQETVGPAEAAEIGAEEAAPPRVRETREEKATAEAEDRIKNRR